MRDMVRKSSSTDDHVHLRQGPRRDARVNDRQCSCRRGSSSTAECSARRRSLVGESIAQSVLSRFSLAARSSACGAGSGHLLRHAAAHEPCVSSRSQARTLTCAFSKRTDRRFRRQEVGSEASSDPVCCSAGTASCRDLGTGAACRSQCGSSLGASDPHGAFPSFLAGNYSR